MLIPATIKGGQRIMAHDPSRCVGHFCSVHNPSDHYMKDWPQLWRDDRGIMERICPHGVGHPDPDDVAFYNKAHPDDKYYIVHGCCGCCDQTRAGAQYKEPVRIFWFRPVTWLPWIKDKIQI
jgi:hypothetical protein